VKYFNITIEGDHTLSIDEIWPDGDVPENPTAEDVRQLIKSQASMDEAMYLIRDWNLRCDVRIQKA